VIVYKQYTCVRAFQFCSAIFALLKSCPLSQIQAIEGQMHAHFNWDCANRMTGNRPKAIWIMTSRRTLTLNKTQKVSKNSGFGSPRIRRVGVDSKGLHPHEAQPRAASPRAGGHDVLRLELSKFREEMNPPACPAYNPFAVRSLGIGSFVINKLQRVSFLFVTTSMSVLPNGGGGETN
jgi:hypothetical protein